MDVDLGCTGDVSSRLQSCMKNGPNEFVNTEVVPDSKMSLVILVYIAVRSGFKTKKSENILIVMLLSSVCR